MDEWDLLGLGAGERVALVGSGGKTTLLFLLGRQARQRGLRAVLTTTTRMLPHPDFIPWEQFLRRPVFRPPRLVARSLQGGKLHGLAPEEVDRMAKLPGVDFLAVEADGSRGLPVKAHADYEPVVPGCTTLVVAVLGLAALGRRLEEGAVHRPERLAQILGLPVGAPLGAEDLGRALSAYLERAPAPRQAVVLTQVTGVSRRQAARRIARRLRSRVDRVLLRGGAEAGEVEGL